MINKVGKVGFLSGLLVSCFVYTQQLNLRITDMYGAPITTIEAGIPFKIQLSMDGCSLQEKDFTIQGLDPVFIDGHQEHISIINGRRSCVHTYNARIDKIGTYTIGPVCAHYQGNQITCQQVSLTVVKNQPNPTTPKQDYFARLIVEKEEIFLGEKVCCHIYFYAKDADARLTNLLAPSSNVKVDNAQYQGPFESVETLQGIQYTCHHIQWLCCPKTVGEFIIPAYTVVYTVPTPDRADFGGFSAFFGIRSTQRMLYSNAVSLRVKPLPPYTGPEEVQALGSYDRFELMIKQATVPVGQALVVTLVLTGSGDLDEVTIPLLQGLPNSCKQYESNSTVTSENQLKTKTFEYIIQATKPGLLTIGEQQFLFFDTKTGHYKTLKTKAQEVMVTPVQEQLASLQTHTLDVDTATVVSTPEPCSVISDLDVPTKAWTIPWWLIWLFFLLPPLIALMYGVYGRCISIYRTRYHEQQVEQAFAHARSCLKKAEKKQDYAALYAIFTRLFALRIQQKQIPIDQAIKTSFIQSGFSTQLYDEWQQFFSTCASFVFLDAAQVQTDAHIFKQAHYWLSLLEQAL